MSKCVSGCKCARECKKSKLLGRQFAVNGRDASK